MAVSKKDLTKKESALPQASVPMEQAEVLRSDILIPYVVLAQGQSESVQQRKAVIGDIVRSTNFEKLGDPEHPLDAIFLHYPKAFWIIEKKLGSRFEYVRSEPRTAANEVFPWSFWCDSEGAEVQQGTRGAIEYRRVKQLLAFAILPRDIEAAEVELKKMEAGDLPDPSKALTPVIMSFRSMSYKAGKEICTFHSQASSMNIPIWKYMLKVGNSFEQNDEGSFYTWKVDRTKITPVKKEHLPMVERWVNIISQGQALQTDDTAEKESYMGRAPEAPRCREI